MLTLEKDETSHPVLGIYHNDIKNPKKPHQTVHFTHNLEQEQQNTAEAAGVLQLHRDFLKKKNRLWEKIRNWF